MENSAFDPGPHRFDAIAELAGYPSDGALIGPELLSELAYQPDGLLALSRAVAPRRGVL